MYPYNTRENSVISLTREGSGTSAEAVSMINGIDNGSRKFIIIEQMDYIKSITLERILNSTINSKEASLVYCEILEDAQSLIEKVQSASEENISKMKEIIYSDNRIVPYITRDELKHVDGEFENLSLEEKKLALIKLIDKNKLYVNYSDMEDKNYNISEEDKKFTKSFYKEV